MGNCSSSSEAEVETHTEENVNVGIRAQQNDAGGTNDQPSFQPMGMDCQGGRHALVFDQYDDDNVPTFFCEFCGNHMKKGSSNSGEGTVCAEAKVAAAGSRQFYCFLPPGHDGQHQYVEPHHATNPEQAQQQQAQQKAQQQAQQQQEQQQAQ